MTFKTNSGICGVKMVYYGIEKKKLNLDKSRLKSLSQWMFTKASDIILELGTWYRKQLIL